MRGLKPLMLLYVAGTLIVSGCTSMRVTTNLKPEADPALKSPAGTFYIAGLKCASAIAGKELDLAQSDAKFECQVLPVLRKECIARYPALFMDDSSTSIPVWVEVRNTTTLHDGKMAAWMFGTAMLAGLIFPCPAEMEIDTDVTVGPWNGRNGMGSGTIQKSFRNGIHQWISLLTPLALIPVPGESDFPKCSFSFSAGEAYYYRVFAQQVATAIAKLITAKDCAFWTTPAQGQGDSVVLPTALPPPKESAAPF